MKVTKKEIDGKVDKLVKKLLEISGKDDQKEIDHLVQDLICVFTLRHAITVAYRTWKELKEVDKKMKKKYLTKK